MEVTRERVKGLLRDGVIFSGANLGDETVVEQSLSAGLCENREEKGDVCGLERISQDVKVSGSEDEEDNGGIRNTGSSGIVP
jgi:hypothetical protein